PLARVRQLPQVSGGAVANGVQRQVRRSRLCRCGTNVEQQVIEVRPVVGGAVAAIATAAVSRIRAVEQLLPAGDLRARLYRGIDPRVEQVEAPRSFGHLREFFRAAARAARTKHTGAGRELLRGGK